MTQKEYIFWLLSNVFLMIGIIFIFFPTYLMQNYGFLFLISGLVLIFFIKDKNASEKPLPKKFYQKKFFWTCIFISLLVIWFIYAIILKNGSSYNFIMVILVAETIIFNYFGMKYKC